MQTTEESAQLYHKDEILSQSCDYKENDEVSEDKSQEE
jgi:hypothetical protein